MSKKIEKLSSEDKLNLKFVQESFQMFKNMMEIIEEYYFYIKNPQNAKVEADFFIRGSEALDNLISTIDKYVQAMPKRTNIKEYKVLKELKENCALYKKNLEEANAPREIMKEIIVQSHRSSITIV